MMVGIFLVVLTFGIFSSFLYFYTQAIFIEKELMKEISKTTEDILDRWSESFIFTNLNAISDSLNTSFGETIKLSGTPENDIEIIKSTLDNMYLQFKKGTFSESKLCKERHFTTSREDCEVLALSSFPLSLATTSVSLSLTDNIYGITSQKVRRVDEQIAKVLILAQDMTYHGLLAVWSSSNFRNNSESCIGNIIGLSITEQKEKSRNCSIKALNEMESKADILTGELKLTELSIPECAQYLPLIEAENLEKYLNNRLATVKNPYLRFYYGVMVKNLDQCSKDIFENLKISNLPCYRPESISLTVKSIASTMSTSGSMAFCMSEAIRNEISG